MQLCYTRPRLFLRKGKPPDGIPRAASCYLVSHALLLLPNIGRLGEQTPLVTGATGCSALLWTSGLSLAWIKRSSFLSLLHSYQLQRSQPHLPSTKEAVCGLVVASLLYLVEDSIQYLTLLRRKFSENRVHCLQPPELAKPRRGQLLDFSVSLSGSIKNPGSLFRGSSTQPDG